MCLLYCFICLMAGACLGVMVLALFVAAAYGDRRDS